MDKTEKLASEIFAGVMQTARGLGEASEVEMRNLFKEAARISILSAKVFYETFEGEDS